MLTFWHPTRPYDLKAAIDRMVLATGSMVNATAGTNAHFNGHRITVDHSPFRQWAATYTWSGIRWLASRCDLETALAAAEREHGKGALGSEVIATVSSQEEQAICRSHGMVPFPGMEARNARVDEFVGPLSCRVNEAVHYNLTDLLLRCTTVEEFDTLKGYP